MLTYGLSSLLQAGCSKVYITSRKAKACEEAVAALNALPNKRPGAQAIAVPADSSKLSEIERLVAEVKKTTDHVDILFANAGATWGEKFDTHPEPAFQKVMDLNVKSVFYCVQKYYVLPSYIISISCFDELIASPTGSHLSSKPAAPSKTLPASSSPPPLPESWSATWVTMRHSVTLYQKPPPSISQRTWPLLSDHDTSSPTPSLQASIHPKWPTSL